MKPIHFAYLLVVSALLMVPSAVAQESDYNEDGQTNMADFAMMQSAFLGQPCEPTASPADENEDGCVDLEDYRAFLVAFLGVGNRCNDADMCPIQGTEDCLANAIEQANQSGMCDSLADPIDQRLCSLNLILNGDVSDGVALLSSALGGIQVDLVPDVANNSPGTEGDGDEPRLVGDPNGFNVAESILLFMPDSNPTDGIDDSFLYVGFDISDFVDDDTVAPAPFDSDDDGSACSVDPAIIEDETKNVFDHFSEAYAAEFQACTSPDAVGPGSEVILSQRNPLSIGSNNDGRMRIRIDEAFGEPLEPNVLPMGMDARSFPTADGVTNPTNVCIDQEVGICGQGNDVEMILAQVETNGAFGPNAVALPDSVEARQNRLALSLLLARLSTDSSGDGGDEEFANVSLRTSIPDLEVTKGVRCADSDGEFTTHVESLPGSEVEFEITIENFGNEDLEITIADVLEDVGSQSGLVSCAPVCESLQATLTSPRRDLTDEPVNPGNATDLGLSPTFFADVCANPDLGFLGSIRNGMSATVGTLQGSVVTREQGECVLTTGDRLVLRFRASVETPDEAAFCNAQDDPDCMNAVSVTGTLPGSADVIARDEAGTSDTQREAQADADDNTATVDVLCRSIDLVKEVRLLASDGMPLSEYTSDPVNLNVPPDTFPVDLEYHYVLSNTGQVDEQAVLNDAQLCSDVVSLAPGVEIVDCGFCDPDGGQASAPLMPGQEFEVTCRIRLNSLDALRSLTELDDQRPDCTGMDETGGVATCCYRNCATATGNPVNLGPICDDAPEVVADASATVCLDLEPRTCEAGGPYTAECAGATTTVALDGSASMGTDVTVLWTTDCPGGMFDDASSLTPMLTVDTGDQCEVSCTATLQLTDPCGNMTDCNASITITDTTAPTLMCPATEEVECANLVSAPDPMLVTTSDDCNDVETMFVDDQSDGQTCPRAITRTYRAVDACDNADTCTQTIMINDKTPPMATCPPEQQFACPTEVPDPDTDLVDASDNCESVTTTHDGDMVVGSTCDQTITRTYLVTDDCQNSTPCTQVLRVIDDVPPTISCPPDVMVACPEDVPAPDTGSVTAEDTCHEVTVEHVEDLSDMGMCPETITRTYRAVDACGNAMTCDQIITIDDDVPPMATCPPQVEVACPVDVPQPSPGDVQASDNCGDPIVEHDMDDTDGMICPETITRTYTAVDNCENVESCTQTIIVNDEEAPELACPPAAELECGAPLPQPDPGMVVVTDNCDMLSATFEGDLSDNLTCPETITRTYAASDTCENEGTCTQDFVIVDTTDPMIECPGPVMVSCLEDVPEPDIGLPVASDICGDVTVEHVGDLPDKMECPLTITRTYRAVDECGNDQTCTQLITVDDENPPTVECPPMATICPGNLPIEDEVPATDDCGPVVGELEDIISEGICPRTSTIIYAATDACGNTATCEQTVIEDDTEPPMITCPDDIKLVLGDRTDPAGAGFPITSDNCGTPSVDFVDFEEGMCPPQRTILRTWTATDGCGQQSSCEQLITINCDNMVPTVSEWGLVILALLLLTGAKIVVRRRTVLE